MAVAWNPFLCGSDMCWLKEAEEEGRISFRHYMAASAQPECTNGLQSYKDVCLPTNAWCKPQCLTELAFYLMSKKPK